MRMTNIRKSEYRDYAPRGEATVSFDAHATIQFSPTVTQLAKLKPGQYFTVDVTGKKITLERSNEKDPDALRTSALRHYVCIQSRGLFHRLRMANGYSPATVEGGKIMFEYKEDK